MCLNTRMLKVSFGQFKQHGQKRKRSPRNVKLKANRASETEEQRKERLRIRREKIEQEGEPINYKRKRKVVRNRRPRETAPGHSQNIEVR